MYAATQLTKLWSDRWNRKNSQELSDGNMAILSPMSPSYLPTINMQDERPTFDVNNQSQDIFPAMSIYVNDGPEYFNSPSQSSYAIHPMPVRKVKRQLF